MSTEYFIVINDQQAGPFSFDDLKSKNVTPDTLVWYAGLPDWVKAAELPELAAILAPDVTAPQPNSQYVEVEEDAGWFAMLGGRRFGPTTLSQLITNGLKDNSPVWHQGMNDWLPASNVAEVMQALSANSQPNNNPYPNFGQNPQNSQYPNFGQNPQQPNFGQNPQYGQQPNFGQNPQYGQQPNFGQNPQYGQQPNFGQNPQYGQQSNFGQNPQYGQQPNYGQNPARTNWLPWAIGATVVGFLFSCIGAIFGIIAIIQANKANGMYSAGFDAEGDQANNTARTMTILGYVLAGIGFVVSFFFLRQDPTDILRNSIF